MEKAMTSAKEDLAGAIRRASQDGPAEGPTALVRLAATFENPINALFDWDRANQLFGAFNNEFGFINRTRQMKARMSEAELTRYTALIRWLIAELRVWRCAQDDHMAALVVIVVVAQICDSEAELWPLLPDDIGANTDLAGYLRELVASLSVNFTTSGPKAAPPHENEALAKFQKAEADGDWFGMIEGWKLFEHQPFLSGALQTQAVRCLNRYFIDDLLQAAANLRQIAVAMQIARALTIEQALRLALASANAYLQLAGAYQSVEQPRPPQTLSPVEQQHLRDLLLKVAPDAPRWAAWMRIFNTYPGRFPLLQPSLGEALAKAPQDAIEPYIKAVHLYPKRPGPDPGRDGLAHCLRVFRSRAEFDRRKALWTAAHSRWLAWNFAHGEPNMHLIWICGCDLDYALVGYAVECMDNTVREAAIQKIRNELEKIDLQWHASKTDMFSAWNRLLSKLQPYARASVISGNDEDWLTTNKVCWPFDPNQNRYLAIKYRAA
jgi:hypothetical protein